MHSFTVSLACVDCFCGLIRLAANGKCPNWHGPCVETLTGDPIREEIMPVSKAKFGARKLQSRANAEIPVLRPNEKSTHKRSGERNPKWCVCVVNSLDGTSHQSQIVREGIVLDAGTTGARVRFRSKSKLPNTVSIKASRIGLNRTARVIWQDQFDAGLAFIEA